MAVISGTVARKMVITIVGASGDGAVIAAKFNNVVVPGISPAAATATNATTTTTVIWADTGIRVGNAIANDIVTRMLAADLTLTAPITVTATSQGYLA
jgi:hypothetical protein